jgi:peptide chain release factor 2
LRAEIAEWEAVYRECADARALGELADEEGDDAVLSELAQECERLAKAVERQEFALMLAGPHDAGNAIVSIHPGAGGTESQDWAAMLLRMYLRWCEQRAYTVEVLDYQEGDLAGIKSAAFLVEGTNAYGYLSAEKGIHRLVRLSPFDANSRRHTSFAAVHVSPEIADEIEVDVKPEDVRVDTFRSGGPGGQHVNRTDSAVRITHIPTGIVVSCQNERSQHKNRATAMRILRSRLFDHYEQKRQEERAKIEGEKSDIGWGHQIRSYVFHPYRMVKDHRTEHETGNVDAVMDGMLDPFIEVYLKRKRSASPPGATATDTFGQDASRK